MNGPGVQPPCVGVPGSGCSPLGGGVLLSDQAREGLFEASESGSDGVLQPVWVGTKEYSIFRVYHATEPCPVAQQKGLTRHCCLHIGTLGFRAGYWRSEVIKKPTNCLD